MYAGDGVDDRGSGWRLLVNPVVCVTMGRFRHENLQAVPEVGTREQWGPERPRGDYLGLRCDGTTGRCGKREKDTPENKMNWRRRPQL
jgi:hypothetical protein